MDQDFKNKCPLCKEEINDADSELVKFSCKHTFCPKCINKEWKRLIKSKSPPVFKCPKCERLASIETIGYVLSDRSLDKAFKREDCEKCQKKIIPIKLDCSHKICINCHTKKIKNSLQFEKKACCFEENCGQTLTIDNLHQLGLRKKYLDLFEEGREKDKKNGNDYLELFQCLICLEAKEKKEFTSLLCKHEFCSQCLLEFFKAKILSNQCDLMCPTCHKEINFFFLKTFLPHELFEKYESLLLTTSIQKVDLNKEKTVRCPECQTFYIVWSDASYFTCSSCRKMYCGQEACLGEWEKHKNLSCQEYKNLFQNQNDEEFEKLAKAQKWVKCPKCLATIEKTKGCNFITCETMNCQKKTTFCYFCNELLSEKGRKNHYINGNEFGPCKGIKQPDEIPKMKDNEDKINLEKKMQENHNGMQDFGESINKNIEESKNEETKNNEKISGNMNFKIKCSFCCTESTEVFDHYYTCKCKTKFCRMCNYFQECKNEEEMEIHLTRCFFEKENAMRERKCFFCEESNFIASKFFIFCKLCYRSLFCFNCKKEIDDYAEHQRKCFKNWAEEDYYSDKKEIDKLRKKLYFCKNCNRICYDSKFSEIVFCHMCDNAHFCKKCGERLLEKEKIKDHTETCKFK